MMIHRTAIVHEDAQLEPDVRVGAYALVGPGVFLGRGTVVDSHAVIERNTRLGAGCHVCSHAVVGSDPQDLRYSGEASWLEIGERTKIREYVTINRGCHGAAITSVGSDCLVMTGVHIAHDCVIGDHVSLANLATLGGHCIVEERAVIGGLAAFHQFVRVGRLAMVGGTAGVMQDVPPYSLVQGAPPATVRGLNLIGLRRSGVPPESISALKHAFRLLFRRGMPREHALAEIETAVTLTPEVRRLVDFIRAESKRGLCNAQAGSTLKVVEGAAPTAQAGQGGGHLTDDDEDQAVKPG
jgi:UDP-N-acetylglucosamine acyltransferase